MLVVDNFFDFLPFCQTRPFLSFLSHFVTFWHLNLELAVGTEFILTFSVLFSVSSLSSLFRFHFPDLKSGSSDDVSNQSFSFRFLILVYILFIFSLVPEFMKDAKDFRGFDFLFLTGKFNVNNGVETDLV